MDDKHSSTAMPMQDIGDAKEGSTFDRSYFPEGAVPMQGDDWKCPICGKARECPICGYDGKPSPTDWEQEPWEGPLPEPSPPVASPSARQDLEQKIATDFYIEFQTVC